MGKSRKANLKLRGGIKHFYKARFHGGGPASVAGAEPPERAAFRAPGVSGDTVTIDEQGTLYLGLAKAKPAAHREYKPAPLVSGLALHSAIVGKSTSIAQIRNLAVHLGLTEEDLGLRCGLSRPTFHRRRKAGGFLSSSETDVLARHALLFQQAKDVFEDEEAARTWLSTRQMGLGQQIPLDLALSTTGFREVEKLLTRIDHGVYA